MAQKTSVENTLRDKPIQNASALSNMRFHNSVNNETALSFYAPLQEMQTSKLCREKDETETSLLSTRLGGKTPTANLNHVQGMRDEPPTVPSSLSLSPPQGSGEGNTQVGTL